jgi:hypothetical protein
MRDLETSRMWRPWPALDRSVTGEKKCILHYTGRLFITRNVAVE